MRHWLTYMRRRA